MLLDDSLTFPDPLSVHGLEPLAIGGDLSVQRLLLAYSHGIFPWQDNPLVWYCPDPRAVLFLPYFRLSQSLKRSVKKKHFTLQIDTNFLVVMQHCQQIKRKHEHSTWISDNFVEAYLRLFEHGFAHSFEIYSNNELVGGLYGISLGSVFMGESMFAKVSDASKVAFFYLVQFCKIHNFSFIDAQVQNPHLESLGVTTISKQEYLRILHQALKTPTLCGKWSQYTPILSNMLEITLL